MNVLARRMQICETSETSSETSRRQQLSHRLGRTLVLLSRCPQNLFLENQNSCWCCSSARPGQTRLYRLYGILLVKQQLFCAFIAHICITYKVQPNNVSTRNLTVAKTFFFFFYRGLVSKSLLCYLFFLPTRIQSTNVIIAGKIIRKQVIV